MDLSGVNEGSRPGFESVNSTATSMSGVEDQPSAQDAQDRPIKRRAGIACRRCRRMRSKCIHEKAQPPCKSCREAGLGAEDCEFPSRGQPDKDREYRHPRMRADKKSLPKATRQPGPEKFDPWEGLPPVADLADGVNRFTRHYFQLGFIHKTHFPQRILKEPHSVNIFLVLAILSVSARLSPSLRQRYGSGIHAADFFMERAQKIASREVYSEPTLELCQAFYVLSIAQQGSGLRNKSSINMGIAVRMATLMMLHREETFNMQNPTPELIMRAESARRTLWMLHSQDSLHSGPLSPVTLTAADITTLLPCNEEDFAAGREPKSRAALDGTPPAIDNPALISDPNRSLFATLMQLHHLWGTVGRRAVSYRKSSRPWEESSQYFHMANHLQQWEFGLPREHTWSHATLKQSKAAGEDLAYLCVTMMTRLCNIVLRRPYLIDVIKRDNKDPIRQQFFTSLAGDLFRNVKELFIQIDAQFTDRTPDESVGAQIAAFCVYSCGLFATYLCKYPAICPDPSIARDGPMMLQRTVTILMECKDVWPLAATWADSLDRFSRDPKTIPVSSSMDDGKDPIPQPIRLPALKQTVAAPTERTLPIPGSSPAASSTMASPRPAGSPAYLTPTAPPPQAAQQQQHQHQHQHSISPAIPPQQQFQLHSVAAHFAQHPSPPNPFQPYQQQFGLPPSQQQQTYMTQPHDGRGSTDGLGMLIQAFDNGHSSNNSPQHQLMQNGMVTAAAGQYYTSMPLVNDGYEEQLQFYIQGAAQPNWALGMDGFTGGAFPGQTG